MAEGMQQAAEEHGAETQAPAEGACGLTKDEREILVSTLLFEIGTAQKYNRLVFELQAEIARLRLTDAERDAVELAIDSMNGVEDISASWSQRETAAIATLRCLLERHFPVPENPPSQDNTPDTHNNQSEVSVQDSNT